MENPTNMANAIQKAYCKQILEQVEQGCHTVAHLKEMAREHEKLCANEDGPHASLDDPYYLGLQAAIKALSLPRESLTDPREAIKLLYDPEQLVVRQRDRER